MDAFDTCLIVITSILNKRHIEYSLADICQAKQMPILQRTPRKRIENAHNVYVGVKVFAKHAIIEIRPIQAFMFLESQKGLLF
jgi:hypothetical protein